MRGRGNNEPGAEQTFGSWALVSGAAGLWALALVLVFFWVPEIQGLGLDGKIFFFHVPAAWLMLLSAVVSGIAAGRALAADRESRLSRVAAELAALFGLLVMTTGPLWAWRAWGRPWVWEPRLTTSLVCWLTFVAASLLNVAPGAGRHKAAQAVSVLGALNVPLVYLSVQWWKGAHHPPGNLVLHMDGRLVAGLLAALAASTALWGLLLAARLRQERLSDRIARLEARLRAPAAGLALLLALGAGTKSLWAEPAPRAREPASRALQPTEWEPGRIARGLRQAVGAPSRVGAAPARPGGHRAPRQASAGGPAPSRAPSAPNGPPGALPGSQRAGPSPAASSPGRTQGPKPEASEQAQGFQPYEPRGPRKGTVAAVLAAYLILWGVMFLYLLALGRRARTLEEKLAALEALAPRGQETGTGGSSHADGTPDQ